MCPGGRKKFSSRSVNLFCLLGHLNSCLAPFTMPDLRPSSASSIHIIISVSSVESPSPSLVPVSTTLTKCPLSCCRFLSGIYNGGGSFFTSHALMSGTAGAGTVGESSLCSNKLFLSGRFSVRNVSSSNGFCTREFTLKGLVGLESTRSDTVRGLSISVINLVFSS